jgi:glyceraldehyde 3-phosphate dehydrogenase
VPVPDGSIVDLVATLGRDTTSDEVNEAFADAAVDKSYRGVIEYTEKPLVSHDIVGNPASCIFSARDTMANRRMVKVLGWYDNEWGYANRLVDVVELMAS